MTEWNAGATGETEAQWRQAEAYLFAQSSTGIAATGVLGGLGVAQTATASGSVVVGRGAAVVQSSLTAGVAKPVSNADKTVDVLTSSPMGALPRYDLVIFNADSAAVEVVVGTPNAAPTDPNVSANHVKLARIRNAANATTITNGSIDDLRVFTTLNVPAAPVWQTYPVLWSQVGGSTLSIGSGTLTGKYRITGKQVTAQVALTRASDTNVGTDVYLFSLPVAAGDINATGAGLLLKSGEKQLAVRVINSTTVVLIDTAGKRISNSNPGSWAAGDAMQFTITYFTP